MARTEEQQKRKREYNRRWYEQNREVVLKKRHVYYEKNCNSIREEQRIYREKNREIIRAQARPRDARRSFESKMWCLIQHGTTACACGEDHPAALDFHHRAGEKKLFKLGGAAYRRYSEEELLAEIQKCDVLCANCHRKHHCNWETYGLLPARMEE